MGLLATATPHPRGGSRGVLYDAAEARDVWTCPHRHRARRLKRKREAQRRYHAPRAPARFYVECDCNSPEMLALAEEVCAQPTSTETPEEWAHRLAGELVDHAEAEGGGLGSGGDPITIGQITVGCALGYLDFRYQSEEWRARARRLAAWYDRFAERKSMQLTQPKA